MSMGRMAVRIRTCLSLIIGITIISIAFICFLIRDQPMNLETILSQTHKQLITIKENFHDVVGGGAGDELSDPRLQVDSKYLKLLGFTVSSGTGPGSSNSNWKSINLTTNSNLQNLLNVPTVIVSAVDKEDMDKVPDFLKSSNTSLPTYPIYLWNLDPTIFDPEYEETDFSLGLKGNCNSTKCGVERFRFEDYPDHVRDKTIRAYRPLIIQTMLEKNPGGCVLWLDIDQRFLPLTKETNNNDKDKDLWNQSLTLALEGGSEGIVGWSSGRPTSTLTHPKMFSFFDTTAEDYYFHRMIDPATLLICNTETVHTKIMLPWIKCSLTKECISPFGAQTGGCRFNKKPLYRYSGCHAYDSSALNVALGITFPLHQPYISRSQLTKPIDLQVSPPSYNYNSLNNSSTNSISSSTTLT